MSKQIVLRVNKGSALTYDEMDRNQSQFYYSSSTDPSGTQLRLHYSGSNSLNGSGVDYSPGFHTVQFPSVDITIPEAVAAGDNTQVQYNKNGAFAADSLFTFNEDSNFLGIGTGAPTYRLHLEADETNKAEIYLNGKSTANSNLTVPSFVSFAENNDILGKVGRINTNEKHTYLTNNNFSQGSDIYGQVVIGITGNTGDELNSVASFDFSGNFPTLGIGTGNTVLDGEARNISVVGSRGVGFGTSTNYGLASYIKPIPTELISQTNSDGTRKFIPNLSTVDTDGLLISSPDDAEGGNLILNINTDSLKHEAFNIIQSVNRDYTNSGLIASFPASGKVGINTSNADDVGLTVSGIVSSSGNFTTEGTATIGTLAAGTSDSTSALVATTAGLVQKIAAAPVPLGGIIMWSGAPNAVPDGWTLCNGSGGANGVTVPDLRNKFVVAAGSSGGTATTNIEGTDQSSGGSNTHNHGGSTGNTTLTISQLPAHSHGYDDAYYAEARSGVQYNVRGDADGGGTDGDNEFFWRTRDNDGQPFGAPPSGNDQPLTETTGSGNSHNHSITSVNNIPEYYALAFIIYVGA